MSEAIQHGTHPEIEMLDTAPMPSYAPAEAEVIDFSQASAEVVTSMFLTQLSNQDHRDLHGPQLASYIEKELSGADDDSTSLRSRLAAVRAGMDIKTLDDDLFDHKYDHDPVFRSLVGKLQETKNARGAPIEREATKSLTELRASLVADTTDDDERWQDVIERLFR